MKVKCQSTAAKCAAAAAKAGVKMFVEVSHAQVYDATKTPSREDDKIKPWTLQAKYRYEAEEAVRVSRIHPSIHSINQE